MARPIKTGLDYFSHSTELVSDEKFEVMQEMYGAAGYMFVLVIWERIYRAGGELDLKNSKLLKVIERKAVGNQSNLRKKYSFDEMLSTALEVGLFDRNAFKSFQVLTSNGIKRRVLTVTRKRKGGKNSEETNPMCWVSGDI
jgi:hypothetical protein